MAVLCCAVAPVELPCAVDGEGLDADSCADGAVGVKELALLQDTHGALASLAVGQAGVRGGCWQEVGAGMHDEVDTRSVYNAPT